MASVEIRTGVSVEEKLLELLGQSMKGDQVAYESFLTMTSAVVKRYLSHLGKGFTDAQTLEDLQQEVILSVHQKKHTYTWDRPLMPWLYAITRYRYIDFYRQKKRAPLMTEWSDIHSSDETFDESPIDWDEVLSLLSPKQRDMFVMVKVEGQTYAHAAQAFSMSVPAVKVSVHRMVKSLKDKVQK
ncbi:MAG: sigma-70 family RNA polymerase sigma factor [Bacteriovoracaceae bacterium]|nr:sigma-70 family RNA polymerase sigma factor [Bacteriovoracaceae bacterium]